MGKPRKHGHASASGESKTYMIWIALRQRCGNPNNKDYASYGGRGIQVCDRWQKFENFLSDMGEKPDGLTVDRWPDKNGNYEPGNCRWASRQEQSYNRRANRYLVIDGVSKCIAEWSKISGTSARLIWNRLHREWPEPEAVFGRNYLPAQSP